MNRALFPFSGLQAGTVCSTDDGPGDIPVIRTPVLRAHEYHLAADQVPHPGRTESASRQPPHPHWPRHPYL